MKTKTPNAAFAAAAFPMKARTALCLALLLIAGPAGAQVGEYRLGVMDKLRIRVAEWQTAEGAIRDWSAVSGDYSVGADGAVSVPFLGPLPADGRTTGELAEEIGQKMQVLFGLRDRPSASVEIAEYRPVYLAGEVQTPGAYPYAPGLTVLKAVSFGGGLRRADAGQRFTRDFLRSEGEAAVFLAERNRLLVRRARIHAEMNNAKGIAMPKELGDTEEARALMESEKALMVSREKRLRLQLTALADLKSLLGTEIDALAKKSQTQTRQLELVQADLDKVDTLAEKGLAISSRRLALEQRTADLQAALLDIDTASLKAKQDINKATQDETNLTNDWDAQLAQELQNTEQELDTLALKLGTSRSLMSEALMQSADAAAFKDGLSSANIAYSILRTVKGKAEEIAATETTPVLPGDVVKVGLSLKTQ
ncbi:polysaccharide biosynthesis/export family protein [Shinella yambaruensis]|uniref:Exopolysaccharide production protein ExoF n=2 Tax=Shinella yambaruensis TaxID=415996 RepID=A0ABQ5ZQ36_9HYPH|nr:polysaccharide biosynthesis/export family protein [Shinella yambaruensis]MCJ8027532.1 polysaccharide biosynthesis/export family protein [Shinella yambaruensis]MCU7982824.1 polysaccharide biosynthesis/export family protein [Shinella yambaruensis]GLR52809.1 exopolysaccharide production protein ExoF [Shinella yambaruensis]